jgi:hypothetical protein
MKEGFYLTLLTVLFTSILGCGSSSSTSQSQPVGIEIIQKCNFQTEGLPTTTILILPQQFNDANWGLKEGVCQQAGYDLVPYAGQNVSLVQYTLTEKYYQPTIQGAAGEPLYLWIIAKDQAPICGYLTVREGSGLIPGVIAVNDSNVR